MRCAERNNSFCQLLRATRIILHSKSPGDGNFSFMEHISTLRILENLSGIAENLA